MRPRAWVGSRRPRFARSGDAWCAGFDLPGAAPSHRAASRGAVSGTGRTTLARLALPAHLCGRRTFVCPRFRLVYALSLRKRPVALSRPGVCASGACQGAKTACTTRKRGRPSCRLRRRSCVGARPCLPGFRGERPRELAGGLAHDPAFRGSVRLVPASGSPDMQVRLRRIVM